MFVLENVVRIFGPVRLFQSCSSSLIETQVTWYKMSSDSSGYTEVVSDTKYNVHPNGSLSIVDVQKGDNGTYKVEISNSAGTVSEEIQVELMQQTC